MEQTKGWQKDKSEERLYFAYSTSLDSATRRAWRSAEGLGFPELGPGELAEQRSTEVTFRSRSARWNGLVGGLAAAPGTSVYGLLFRVPASAWPLIEAYEASQQAHPQPTTVSCKGKATQAIAFSPPVTAPSGSGEVVSEAFVAAMLRGAIESKLPQPYLEQLQAEALILERVQQFGRENHLIGSSDEVSR